MTTLAIAGLSARMGVELAVGSGLRAVALDVFGDLDTHRAASRWMPIGDAATLRIDGTRLLAALAALARSGEVEGWVAAGGFEAQPELLAQGAACLPLIGTAPADVQRLRDPRDFFAMLRDLRVPHPPVRFEPPAVASGWLVKEATGSGGWGVQRAGSVVPPGAYWQQERRGRPMSATLVANGDDAVLLGLNEQCVGAVRDRPFVFHGVIGPVPASDAVQRAVAFAARAIAREYRLRGLASLDFLLDGDAIEVLEVNPRLVASAGLYADAQPLRLHCRACLHGELPAARAGGDRVHGWQIVFARRPMRLSESAAALIARWPCAHDRPRAGTGIDAGSPLCSLGASGLSSDEVRVELARSGDDLLDALEGVA